MEYKVLLAEDEKSLRDIVSKYLSRNGFIVDTAVDGNEAMIAVDNNVCGLCL